jgi:hypothetical protein
VQSTAPAYPGEDSLYLTTTVRCPALCRCHTVLLLQQLLNNILYVLQYRIHQSLLASPSSKPPDASTQLFAAPPSLPLGRLPPS